MLHHAKALSRAAVVGFDVIMIERSDGFGSLWSSDGFCALIAAIRANLTNLTPEKKQ
jgi:hypothetical protein